MENKRSVRTHYDYEGRPGDRDESGNERRRAGRKRRAEGKLPGLGDVRWRPLKLGDWNFDGKLGQENDGEENHVSRWSRQVGDSRIETRIHGILDWTAAITATGSLLFVVVRSRLSTAIHRLDKFDFFKKTIPCRQRINERQQRRHDCLPADHRS